MPTQLHPDRTIPSSVERLRRPRATLENGVPKRNRATEAFMEFIGNDGPFTVSCSYRQRQVFNLLASDAYRLFPTDEIARRTAVPARGVPRLMTELRQRLEDAGIKNLIHNRYMIGYALREQT